ncbi:hypothetical protein DV736_g6571, partial [Chaetothyriales sp. CBS 134916]
MSLYPAVAPRGKIPYVKLEGSPGLLGDSTLIIRKFVDEGYLPDLNAGLTAVQKAQDLAVRALLEDKLYFYQVRERWQDNYYTMRDGALAVIPYPIRVLVGMLAYRGVLRTLQGQGTLRFSLEEMAALRLEVWESINTLLVEARSKMGDTDGPFWVLGGAGPTDADPVVFGFIAASLVCQAAPDTEKIVRSFPIVMDYARRIHDRYFSDYERWQD